MATEVKQKKCQRCGSMFTPKVPWIRQRFCRRNCRDAAAHAAKMKLIRKARLIVARDEAEKKAAV